MDVLLLSLAIGFFLLVSVADLCIGPTLEELS